MAARRATLPLTASAAAAVVVVVVLALCSTRVAADDSLCVFNYQDGEYDLTQITAPSGGFTVTPTPGQDVTIGGDPQYNYRFSVCNALESCNDAVSTDPAAVCQMSGSDNSIEFVMAYESNIGITKTSSYLLATYGSGQENWKATIQITCNMDAVTTAEMQDTVTAGDSNSGGNGAVAIQMSSIYACANQTEAFHGGLGNGDDDGGGGGGLSGGSILLILILCSTVVYCGVGAAYNVTQRQATGADVVPNKEFWVMLPGLTLTGVKASVSFVSAKVGGGGGGGSNYEQL